MSLAVIKAAIKFVHQNFVDQASWPYIKFVRCTPCKFIFTDVPKVCTWHRHLSKTCCKPSPLGSKGYNKGYLYPSTTSSRGNQTLTRRINPPHCSTGSRHGPYGCKLACWRLQPLFESLLVVTSERGCLGVLHTLGQKAPDYVVCVHVHVRVCVCAGVHVCVRVCVCVCICMCVGYIDTVQSCNPGSSLPSDDLLRACRGLLGISFHAPQHLYLHRVGRVLGVVLDGTDGVPKRQAQAVKPQVGWVPGLQEPQVCFTHNGI